MDTALLQGVIIAAAVSLLATFAFLAVAKTGLLFTRRSRRRSAFAGAILFEAGHRFRKKMNFVDASTSVHLTAGLVFLIVFLTVSLIETPTPAVPVPAWAWALGAVSVLAGICFIPYSLVRLLQQRSRLAYVRDAHMAIGHALQGTSLRGSRVFHDVTIGRTVIDHVVVSASGVYAVNVVVRRQRRRMFDREARYASLNDNALDFDGVKDQTSLAAALRRSSRLSAALTKVTAEPVKTRPVIAVPGWRVGGPSHDQLLLVNEKNLMMMTGWTDKDSYLMDEDVAQIIEHLSKCCRA